MDRFLIGIARIPCEEYPHHFAHMLDDFSCFFFIKRFWVLPHLAVDEVEHTTRQEIGQYLIALRADMVHIEGEKPIENIPLLLAGIL